MADLLFRELSEKQEATIETKDFDSEISKEFSLSVDSTVLPAEEGAGAWTVSTKTRRLAPAFTLSRKDLGTDSPRNIAAVQELAAAKKRGETMALYWQMLSPFENSLQRDGSLLQFSHRTPRPLGYASVSLG